MSLLGRIARALFAPSQPLYNANRYPLVSSEQVRIYVRKHYPGWSWCWTVVDVDGYPQVRIERAVRSDSLKKISDRHYKLITQKEICSQLNNY